MTKFPANAIIAITLNCNSRCTMCNIWKNKIANEMKPDEYLKLPPTLKDINITGGEPFLRMDLPEIVEAMKKTAPKARLVLNTNGYLPRIIEGQIPKILKIDPKFAIRVSLDGLEKTHDEIRGIPNGFKMIIESLSILDTAGVKDLGVSFTIMKKNIRELPMVFDFCRRRRLELSLTMVTSSDIYFGKNKESLRPDNHQEVSRYLNRVIVERFRSHRPKDWFRGWFEKKLLDYYFTHRRPLTCDAGENFFYLDSLGKVYSCHVRGWLMGDLRRQTFKDIWFSNRADKVRGDVKMCNDCWMVCTAKTGMKRHLAGVTAEIVRSKLANLK